MTLTDSQLDGANAALDEMEFDFDPSVVEEAGETVPTREGMTDCLSELGLLADQGELGAQPGFQAINDRLAPVLANGAASSAVRPRMSFSTA